jgi:hypothetical protein
MCIIVLFSMRKLVEFRAGGVGGSGLTFRAGVVLGLLTFGSGLLGLKTFTK